MTHQKIRIGIDVGGTFTHAVAIPEDRFELLAQSKVPTTHTAAEGVALGIVHALKEIMESAAILPADIMRIALSTTQATNALLEGDVLPVGILALGLGWEGKVVRSGTEVGAIELAPGRNLEVYHHYLELPSGGQPDHAQIVAAIQSLKQRGSAAIVAASAFSVDDPSSEKLIVELAQREGLPATATHEISSLYGLEARTRTAAINAAILPKMVHTAEMTEQAVRSMGITAPLVVMRSDGGAMSIDEMKKRPILTLLSGPAAGVAAALMAAKIADGIFLEVGGTSTDISCIMNGHPSIKMAQIGNHRIYLDTLDVRTVGVAGGSLPRVRDGKIEGVGPRSAHIAGCRYGAFPGKNGIPKTALPQWMKLPTDPADYFVLEDSETKGRWTATTTCAANLLGYLPEDDYARGSSESAEHVLSALATATRAASANAVAEEMLHKGSLPLIDKVNELIREKNVEPEKVSLLGGGGGAGVWVHYLSKRMGHPGAVVEHAPVISAIGAAMALLQETVERTLIDPQPDDMISIRQQAESLLVQSGANPDTIEVRVEVDHQRGILRAVATGSQLTATEAVADESLLRARGAELLGVAEEAIRDAGHTTHFRAYQATVTKKRWGGWAKKITTPWLLFDSRGRVRCSASHGEVLSITAQELLLQTKKIAERHSVYNDGGLVLPALFLATPHRLVDLSGLATLEQIIALCEVEQGKLHALDSVVVAVKG